MGVEDQRSRAAVGRTVPAIAENIAPLRHAVVDLARRHGADEAVQIDLGLAVGEACANVVVHAYPPGDVGVLVLQARVDGGELTVSVIDQGQGVMPRADGPGLGLGLPLIANLASRLELQDGPGGAGTELVMTFVLRRSED